MSNKGLEIIASDLTDPSQDKKTEPKVLGRFPGVVSFYPSLEQLDGKFGKEDSIDIPTYGFDNYTPALYGNNNNVKSKYVTSNNIVSGYVAKKDDGTDVPIAVYPQKKRIKIWNPI